MHRGIAGWSIATDVQTIQGNLLAELQSLAGHKTSGEASGRVRRDSGGAGKLAR